MKTKTLTCCLPLSILAVAIGISATVSESQDKDDTKVAKIAENLPEEAPAKAKEKRKVLVFSKTNGFRHGSIGTGIEAMRMLGTKTGAFEITATEDESAFEPDNLKQYHAVLMLNTTGEVFRPKDLPADEAEKKAALDREEMLKKSLLDFVNGGGGLAGIHAATDTYKNWKEYTDMMGGAFDGHPWHELVSVKNMAPEHPVNAAFKGEDFEVTDEIYQFRKDTASPKERKMLLALSADKTDLKKGKYGEDGLYPVSWLRKYGEGRTFYCSLGHRDEIFWNPVVMKHFLAGLQFVLGDLEADATVSTAPVAIVEQPAIAAAVVD